MSRFSKYFNPETGKVGDFKRETNLGRLGSDIISILGEHLTFSEMACAKVCKEWYGLFSYVESKLTLDYKSAAKQTGKVDEKFESLLVCHGILPDGNLLGTSSLDVCIWHGETGQRLITLEGKIYLLRKIFYSKECNQIIGADDNHIYIWNMKGEREKTISIPRFSAIHTVKLLTQHILFLAGASSSSRDILLALDLRKEEKEIILAKIDTGPAWKDNSGIHALEVFFIKSLSRWEGDKARVIIAKLYSTEIWEINFMSGKVTLIQKFEEIERGITVFKKDRALLLCGSSKGYVERCGIDTYPWKSQHIFGDYKTSVTAIEVLIDGNIAIGYSDGCVTVINRQRQCVATYKEHVKRECRDAICAIMPCADGSFKFLSVNGQFTTVSKPPAIAKAVVKIGAKEEENEIPKSTLGPPGGPLLG